MAIIRRKKLVTKVATPAKKNPVGRPRKLAVVPTKVAKRVTKVVPVKGKERIIDPVTGFTMGSDQQIISDALMAGADTRQDIVESLRKKLSPVTRNGTEKPIANLVSSVFNNLALKGFTLDSHWQVLAPTPASKRKATRAANKKSA